MQPGDTRVCANITIIGDELIENAERFIATISSEEDFVVINNPTTTVEIAGELGKMKGEGERERGREEGMEGRREAGERGRKGRREEGGEESKSEERVRGWPKYV